jgi:hypothetical protein
MGRIQVDAILEGMPAGDNRDNVACVVAGSH